MRQRIVELEKQVATLESQIIHAAGLGIRSPCETPAMQQIWHPLVNQSHQPLFS